MAKAKQARATGAASWVREASAALAWGEMSDHTRAVLALLIGQCQLRTDAVDWHPVPSLNSVEDIAVFGCVSAKQAERSLCELERAGAISVTRSASYVSVQIANSLPRELVVDGAGCEV